MGSPLHEHLALHRCDRDTVRRCESAAELELHDEAHHVRMRSILGTIAELDGVAVLRSAARDAFAGALAYLLHGVGDEGSRSALAEGYYAHLGLGMVWLDTIAEGTVQAPTSLVAGAWSRRRPGHGTRVCAVTEGFIEAAVQAITGRNTCVRELECMAEDAPRCRFAITPSSEPARVLPSPTVLRLVPPSRTVIAGDVDGLIRIDGDHFANLPAGLYVQALADWLALAARRGAPVLANAIAQLDYVTAPATAPLHVVPND